jgi:hypothetical protein
MLYLTKIVVITHFGYDDFNDILVKIYGGFILPMSKNPSTGYYIGRKIIRTAL